MTNVLSRNCVTPPKEHLAAVTDRLDDDPDCLWEPSLVFDQDAEARQREWEESFAYFLNNGETY